MLLRLTSLLRQQQFFCTLSWKSVYSVHGFCKIGSIIVSTANNQTQCSAPPVPASATSKFFTTWSFADLSPSWMVFVFLSQQAVQREPFLFDTLLENICHFSAILHALTNFFFSRRLENTLWIHGYQDQIKISFLSRIHFQNFHNLAWHHELFSSKSKARWRAKKAVTARWVRVEWINQQDVIKDRKKPRRSSL